MLFYINIQCNNCFKPLEMKISFSFTFALIIACLKVLKHILKINSNFFFIVTFYFVPLLQLKKKKSENILGQVEEQQMSINDRKPRINYIDVRRWESILIRMMRPRFQRRVTRQIPKKTGKRVINVSHVQSATLTEKILYD